MLVALGVAPATDWLRGDTIVALFDTVRASPADSARAEIRELIAFVGARSYQHMPPRDTSLRCPAISYVRGDSLRARFEDGQVRTVDVVKGSELSGGIIAEPDSTCRAGSPANRPAADPQLRPEARGGSSPAVPGRIPASSPAPFTPLSRRAPQREPGAPEPSRPQTSPK